MLVATKMILVAAPANDSLVVRWLVPHETAAASAHVLCTPYNVRTSLVLSEAVCLAAACIFHQTDQALLLRCQGDGTDTYS